MKIAQFTGTGKIEIVEGPKPELSGAGDVLLRIERVGICGSDVHYYREGRIGSAVIQYPASLGHECAGTVVEVYQGPHPRPRPLRGARLRERGESLKPGDRVAVDPAISCGTCDQCLAGRENTCRNLRFMGSPGEAAGAAAEFCVMPAKNCFPVSDSISLDTAVLVEPLAVGLHAVRLSDIRPDASIAILGSGPIGLSVLLCVKAAAPTCLVYMADLLNERLQVATRCGADWTGNARDENIAAAILGRQPHGLDAVFECSGDPAALNFGQKLLTPGGMLLLVGIPPVEKVGFDIHYARRRELILKNVRRQKGCTGAVIEMIETGQIDPRPMLTHHFPLEKITEAFDLVEGYRDGVIKAIIEILRFKK